VSVSSTERGREWSAVRRDYRWIFAAGLGLILASFLLGTAYPLLVWRRPPGLSQDPLILARQLLAQRRLGPAIREFQISTRISPGNPQMLAELGNALGQSGDPEGEIQAYSTAARLRPDARGYIRLAEVLFRNRRVPAAITTYEEALRFDPANTEAWAGLGAILLAVDRFPEAVDAYSNVLRSQPDNGPIHNEVGIAYALQGKYAEAIRHFSQAVSLNPTPDIVANLRKAKEDQERAQAAGLTH
jgi:tetratricopeptide (TPR) repeat protein